MTTSLVSMPATVSRSGSDARSRDEAFAAIALPLLPAITRLARALAGNAADADDLVQETYLRAFRYWHSFTPGTDCRLWLARICRNALHDMRRRESREIATEDAELESLASARVHTAAVANPASSA
jgi:RNA polymerase sigma-70 factor, ECF subfamily